jgi:hypothetical protein
MTVMAALLLLGALALWRFERALAFKVRVLGQVLSACDSDQRLGRPSYWRILEWSKVAEERLVVEFWRPLRVEEWWPNTGFASPGLCQRDTHLRLVK